MPEATKSSPKCFAHVNLNCLLPEHSQIPQNHHQNILPMSESMWITYILNTTRSNNIITKRFCTCQYESLTYWTQPEATKSSPTGSVHVSVNHLLSEHSQMSQNHHWNALHINQNYSLYSTCNIMSRNDQNNSSII